MKDVQAALINAGFRVSQQHKVRDSFPIMFLLPIDVP
jgi:hypothetical protein